ncbi:MAG: carbohydrate ABC transporter permease [Phycisphaerae bacterium]|jgi:ABC-type sugar transport system permease subunit
MSSLASADRARAVFPWLLLAPFLLLVALFTITPLVGAAILSSQQTFGPGTARFVGLSNFKNVLADPLFWTAFKNTFIFTLGSVFVQLPLALLFAMLLNQPGVRGRSFFRLVLFSPVLVGVVYVAMIFFVLFQKRTGLVNQLLHGVFPSWDIGFAWLDQYIMVALILATLWQYMGFNMVYFLAALQNVPKELDEAARIDGASWWKRFRHVTLPAITPVGSFVVLLSIIGSFQVFELPFLLLQGSTGVDNKGLTIVGYLYQTGFQSGDLGYASAIGWTIAVVLAGAAILQRVLSGSSEQQRGGRRKPRGGAA